VSNRPNAPRRAALTIVNVGYSSTNYWVISAGSSRLLVDLGYPGTMTTMRSRLSRMDVPLTEVRYALATHYHIDHAGLGQDLKNAGIPLLVLESQISAIPAMKQWTKPADGYTEIEPHGNVVIAFAESRRTLDAMGISGEILPTPGHSDDSVSLLLDDGSVFTGDLTLPSMASAEQADGVRASWRLLASRGAERVHPGHGPVYSLAERIGPEIAAGQT
jgi:endoribonuclease LACTB2